MSRRKRTLYETTVDIVMQYKVNLVCVQILELRPHVCDTGAGEALTKRRLEFVKTTVHPRAPVSQSCSDALRHTRATVEWLG